MVVTGAAVRRGRHAARRLVRGTAVRGGPHAVRRLVRAATAVATLLLALAACGSSSSGSRKAAQPSAPPSPTAPPSAPGGGKKFYVSIGDSYAVGYMPTSSGAIGSTTTSGFAYQLGSTATVRGQRLTLVNFGCGGATTTSLLRKNGCLPERLGPGAAGYPSRTQAQAALSFISMHRADIALVTVVIGGNDFTSCAKGNGSQAIAACLTKALATVASNLHGFLPELRAAGGPGVLIVGITYPDVILGQYVSGTATGHSLAALSVTAFKALINPVLAAQYRAVGATFVDVTAATGAYLPFTQTTTLAPYGKVPAAVAKACQLTYYCQFHDIHPRAVGYALIADQIRKALPG